MYGFKGAIAVGLAIVGTTAQAAEAEEPVGAAIVEASAGSAAADMSLSASTAAAEPEGSANDTEVIFTPYLWVAGINGDIAIPRGDSEVEIDKSFSDLLGNLNFAFMGALEVRHDRFVAIGDIMYLNATVKAESVDSTVFFEGKVDNSLFVGTAAAGYRIVEDGPVSVDLFAGVRFVSINVDVELTGPLQTRERSASPSNVSGLVGGRVLVPLGDRWAIALYGDIGNILGDADIKWQLLGTVQRNLGRNWRMAFGYRYAAIDHEGDDLEFDIGLSGPILGISYRF